MTLTDASPHDPWAGDDQGDDQSEQSAWIPENLDDVLDGTYVPVVPELGRRQDGVPLLYRGKEHVVAGEPESGKTWFMLMCARDVLVAGGRVTYVDFEDDAATVVGRLRGLGTLTDRLRPSAGQFRYIRPDSKPRWGELDQLLTYPTGTCDLLIYDGWTEGAGLMGLNIMDQGDMAVWRRQLVRPALSMNTAVITSDHVVKDKEGRGRYGIGAQHKLAGLTGAMFVVEVAETWGRGSKGRSKILITKDRPGSLRPHGKRDDKANFTHIGDLVGDATSGEMTSLTLWPPFEAKEVEADDNPIPFKIRGAVEQIQRILEARIQPASFRTIKAEYTGKDEILRAALEWLTDAEMIKIEIGARNSRLHHWVGLASANFDD